MRLYNLRNISHQFKLLTNSVAIGYLKIVFPIVASGFRGAKFLFGGVAPWPPLVAALAERDILRGERNTLRGGTVTPRRGSDTLRGGKVTLRGGRVTVLEGRDPLRGGTVVTLRGERDILRGGRGILRSTLNFVKVVSS